MYGSRVVLLTFLLALWLSACAGDSSNGPEPAQDDDDDIIDDDAVDDDAADDDQIDDDTTPIEFQVTVKPASPGNLLAREIAVVSSQPCSISGAVTTSGEPGFSPSDPAHTEVGTQHSLWFYGLLQNTVFVYHLHLAGQPDAVFAEGEFETPALPNHVPQPSVYVNESDSDPSIWTTGIVNSPIATLPFFLRAVGIWDKQGRLRLYHEDPLTLEETVAPLQGSQVFSNGDIVYSDMMNLMALKPNGTSYMFRELKMNQPYFKKAHHLFYVEDYNSAEAWILFNQFGPGVECDLTTPTDQAIGDGMVIIDEEGDEIWRWTAFDHQDRILPTMMNQCACLNHHFGAGTYDWTHGNTVAPIPGQNAFLISLRNVLQIVKVNIPSGEIEWQMGPGLDFTWIGDDPPEDQWFRMQHDPEWLPDNHLLMFDNGNCRYDANCNAGPWSRALELVVDEEARTVEKFWEHRVSFSHAMGETELLPNGNILIFNGWQNWLFEVTRDHVELFKARFGNTDILFSMRYYPALWIYE